MDEARDFLNALFGATPGYLELTYIDPQRHYGLYPGVFSESYLIGRDRIDWQHVATHNRRGYGVYYGLATKHRAPAPGKRATESDARFINCLWAEVDLKDGAYASLGDITRALKSMLHPPTIQIASGGGIHALWRIAPVLVSKDNFAQIKRMLRGLGKAIQGDLSVAELARVFRLPGTVNTKPERGGEVCRVIFDSGPHYSLGSFARYMEPERPKSAPHGNTSPGDGVPGFLRWFLTHPHPHGTRNNALNWTAYRMWEAGFSQLDAESMLLPRAVACGLDERGAVATIRSPYKK
jgi:hypothetical protein